jgi:hypothetical protein
VQDDVERKGASQVRISNQEGGCRPTELQELLLKAALLQGQEAFAAWCEWNRREGLEQLDQGSLRTLPLVYWNLEKQGFQHPLMGMLRGVRRRAWYENRLLFRRMAPVIEGLHRAGIPTLLLKGAPLALLYYSDPGLRSMQDFDVLVPEAQALPAMRLLESQGWKQEGKNGGGFRFRESDLRFRHSIMLSNRDGVEIDVHWHVLYLASYRGADRPFWEAGAPLVFEGISTRALCASDQLLHACTHGPMWDPVPPMRWVADAFIVMRSSKIDWQRLLMLAERLRIVAPVREGLEYLATALAAPVPTEVLAALRRIKVSRPEELEYQLSSKPWPLLGPIESVLATYHIYARCMRGETRLAKLARLPRYLQCIWRLERPQQLWPEAMRRILQRIRLMSPRDASP